MAYTQENIQFSKSVVKYNLINFINLLIDMGPSVVQVDYSTTSAL